MRKGWLVRGLRDAEREAAEKWPELLRRAREGSGEFSLLVGTKKRKARRNAK